VLAAVAWHAVVVTDGELSGPCLEAMRRGFHLARELDRCCGPVHFLVGIGEGHGPAAVALDPGQGRSLRAVVTAAAGPAGDGAGYLHMQAQAAAMSLARSRGEQAGPGHLLIALLDQGTPPVRQALSQAGLDPATVRRAAAAAIGAGRLPALALPALTAAGTLDRPPLPVTDLDRRAWTVLRWRQDHLPLGQLRRPFDRAALSHLERSAASRLAQQLGLDDDQRFSLICHHASAVEQAVASGRPDLSEPRGPAEVRRRAMARSGRRRGLRRHFRNVTAGFRMWFRNRRAGLRNRWFSLRTIRCYRRAPQP
jgi:hypothetical protein